MSMPNELSSDSFLEKLRRALGKNGDFPASAKTVSELIELTSRPGTTANAIAEVILREPSLSLRILALVNSSFYLRGQPVTSLSQAIVQVGMKAIAEMCAGLVLIQKLLPEARKNSVFTLCFRRSVVTSLIAGSLATHSSDSKSKETGALLGFMSEIGTLLMTYYFPQVYENALKRSLQKSQPIERSIHQMLGLTTVQLSIEVITTLGLPPFYREVMHNAESSLIHGVSPDRQISNKVTQAGQQVGEALAISSLLCGDYDVERALAALKEICTKFDLEWEPLVKTLSELPDTFHDYCHSLEIVLPAIPVDIQGILKSNDPSYVSDSGDTKTGSDSETQILDVLNRTQAGFSQYLTDLEEAISSGEMVTSILTAVMEACAYGLSFDRVVLLLASKDRRSLLGRMGLGELGDFEPSKCVRPLGDGSDPYAPDNQAFSSGSPIFQGDPVISNGWPFVAIPIGSGKRCIGVIYADKIKGKDEELTQAEQAAVMILAQRLDSYLRGAGG